MSNPGVIVQFMVDRSIEIISISQQPARYNFPAFLSFASRQPVKATLLIEHSFILPISGDAVQSIFGVFAVGSIPSSNASRNFLGYEHLIVLPMHPQASVYTIEEQWGKAMVALCREKQWPQEELQVDASLQIWYGPPNGNPQSFTSRALVGSTLTRV